MAKIKQDNSIELEKQAEVKVEEPVKARKTVDFKYPVNCTIKRNSDAYLNSKKYICYKDMLSAVLSKDETYTEVEVVEIIENYLNKEVF